MQKNSRTKTESPHGLPTKGRKRVLTHGHDRCRGESGALCFVLPVYDTTHFSFCQGFFQNIFAKAKKIFVPRILPYKTGVLGRTHRPATGRNLWQQKYIFATCDKNVIGKCNKLQCKYRTKFLLCMLFHKNQARISSEIIIYKSTGMRYNSYAVGEYAGRFPLLHTAVPFSAKCQSHGISARIRQVQCAILCFVFHQY